MSTTRRSLVKGAAWAAPAIATTTLVPAYAASTSTDDYFVCPTTLHDLTEQLVGGVSSISVSSYYNSGSFLAPLHQDGSSILFSFSTGRIKPVPVYGPDGKPKVDDKGNAIMTTGAYFIPGCGKTTCVPDVDGGFKMPTAINEVVIYDRTGARHIGTITAGTPTGCSPVTNAGVGGTWTIHADLQYSGSACTPVVGPENLIRQISLPFSLMYIKGLTEADRLKTKGGSSCCFTMNFYFDDSGNCTSSVDAISADYTSGLPAAPQPVEYVPHLAEWYRLKDGSETNSFRVSAANNEFHLSGSGFTTTTSVTWNDVEVPFEIISDNLIKITFPLSSSHSNGIFYSLKVTNAVGVSSNQRNMARYS
ncbi:hypothetical protein ACFP6B_01605 [Rothia nasimurium]|uniref:hypothetical protein n=1 Tax=Rothia nasimurium TaxID=85336 RepID=UPI003611EBF5